MISYLGGYAILSLLEFLFFDDRGGLPRGLFYGTGFWIGPGA